PVLPSGERVSTMHPAHHAEDIVRAFVDKEHVRFLLLERQRGQIGKSAGTFCVRDDLDDLILVDVKLNGCVRIGQFDEHRSLTFRGKISATFVRRWKSPPRPGGKSEGHRTEPKSPLEVR